MAAKATAKAEPPPVAALDAAQLRHANASADHTNSACVRAVGGDAELAAAPALAPTMTPTKTSASATALLQA